jgi:hypothetical protein
MSPGVLFVLVCLPAGVLVPFLIEGCVVPLLARPSQREWKVHPFVWAALFHIITMVSVVVFVLLMLPGVSESVAPNMKDFVIKWVDGVLLLSTFLPMSLAAAHLKEWGKTLLKRNADVTHPQSGS